MEMEDKATALKRLFEKYKLEGEEKITDDSLLSAGVDEELVAVDEAITTLEMTRDNIKLRDALKTIAYRAIEKGNVQDAKIALNIM